MIGQAGDEEIFLNPRMANRHGMIAGATGTGKTTTVKTVAESFAEAGVPVFIADVKGDLAGISVPGNTEYATAHPTNFWDVYEAKGMPLRTTISEMGPMLLSRVLGLNQTQSEILTVIFKIADDEELLLIDTKDLRAMLNYVGENAQEYSLTYGNIAKQSLAAIIRAVIALESEGGDQFFGEPAIDIKDWFRTDCDGKGFIQVLDCQKLILNPTMYSTILLWLLSEMYETLPEVGDLPKPRMVFFFDEAHLLFDNASKDLLDKVEQVVKLIRSKGVGIFFITQAPQDIPDGVLAQLGNKLQHALRAYTPAEQKKVKAAAQSYRTNPEFDTYEALQELQIGECLVSTLDESGIPTMVQRVKIMLPASSMGTIDDATRASMINASDLYLKYRDDVDRDSAYEFLQRKAVADMEAMEAAAAAAEEEKERLAKEREEAKAAEREAKAKEREEARAAAAEAKAKEKAELDRKKAEQREYAAKHKAKNKAIKSVANSAVGTIGREVGNTIGNSVGGKFGKKIGGNVGASLARGIIGTLLK